MFNEVYVPCECGSKACAQISQVVLGFGEFNLSEPETYSNLDEDEKSRLFKLAKEAHFHCEGCGNGGQAKEHPVSSFKLD